jgi:hypothetical protein
MKNSTIFTLCFSLPLLWFMGYVVLILIGCIASTCGAGDQFYCSIYCKFGVGFMIAITGGFLFYNVIKHCRLTSFNNSFPTEG